MRFEVIDNCPVPSPLAEEIHAIKRCSKCGGSKPLDEFLPRRDAKDGHRGECADCTRAYRRAYRAANRVRLSAEGRAWREANSERKRASDRAHYAANRERRLQQANAYRAEHRDERIAYLRGYYRAHRDERRAKGSAYAAEHRAERTAYRRRWARANPDLERAIKRKRRARQRGAFVESVHELVVLERASGLCGICGLSVDPARFEIDHIVPLSRGGEHSYANTQLAHPVCNRRKGARLPEEMAA